ncbi:MAG TPA: glycosyltransferase [Candidatus Omnitrophota bacterium]|nr:glycosyltransferase [Candidatus Omnitrophota bacterium]HPD85183.1 glycosyltransferase [Candidatus Omnitrophota bacterium]HRZ04316.1 glycosyltransferase [Candidatus Omnitrophota bacterium]
MTNNHKINILFVLPNFDTGGSEKLVIDIIKGLDRTVFNPVLAVFFTGSYEQEFLKLGVPFYKIHFPKLRFKISTVLFLSRIVRKHRIHLANTHHTSPLIQGFLPFKLFNRVKLIHTEHSPLKFDKKIHSRALAMEKFLLGKVDAVVGVSKSVCKYFEDELHVPARKIRYVPNGIDINRFNLSNFDRQAYRQKLGLREDDVVVGLFANLREEKNHHLLIEALSTLHSQGYDKAKLLLCGSGPKENELRALVSRLRLENNVIFLGTRFDIPELMSSIDIYCLPSRYEGMPMSILEAMAAKKPVIATNVEGIKEVIENGFNGILIKENSAEELASAISDLIKNESRRTELSSNAYDFVKKYSYGEMMKSYENLFLRMLKRNEPTD